MEGEERKRFFTDGEVERGDFSYMDYVPSEPPELKEPRSSSSRQAGLRDPSSLLTKPRLPAQIPRRLPDRRLPAERTPAARAPRRALAFALGGLAAVVMLGMVAHLVLSAPAPVTAGQATATTKLLLETQEAGSPGAGWIAAGPAHAQAIAFAPSAPGTAYACAPAAPGVESSPIGFGISTDAGQSWKLLATQVRGIGCDLTVDPNDANDIVLVANVCRECQTPQRISLYRTLDAGLTWRPWELPLEGSDGVLGFESYQWTWAGSTLYLAPWNTGDTAWTRIAVSVGGEPFYWADAESLFVGSPTGATIDGLLGSGETVYVTVDAARGCAQSCWRVMRSADFGMSWTLLAPSDAGLPVRLLPSQASPHGATQFGQVYLNATTSARLYVQSTDGGATWQALPAFPAVLSVQRILQTPDGTMYGALVRLPGDGGASGAAPGIYRLRSGDSAWAFAAEFPANPAGPLCVAWDERGVPLALWGGAGAMGGSGGVSGLEYHAP